MAYDKTVWADGDLITAERMNKIENGIEDAQGGGGGDAHGIPSGGSANQALVKTSNTDYAVAWKNLIWIGTQEQYDALSTYDSNTLYCIKE